MTGPAVLSGHDVVVVFDAEYTSWEGSVARGWSGPGEDMEVVEIGAVKLDGRRMLAELDCFQVLVRPRVNPVLSDHFVTLTGIRQADVEADGIELAEEAVAAFAEFLGEETGAALSHGGDHAAIEANCRLVGIPCPLPVDRFGDVRPAIAEAMHRRPGSVMASDLAALFGFPPPGRAHRALADARCVAEALRMLGGDRRT